MKKRKQSLKGTPKAGSARSLLLVVLATGTLLTMGYALGFSIGAGQSERQASVEQQAMLASQNTALAEVQASRNELQQSVQALRERMGEETETRQSSLESLDALQRNLSELRQDYAALGQRSVRQTEDLRATEAMASRLRSDLSAQAELHAEAQTDLQATHRAERQQQQDAHDEQLAQLRAALLQAGLDGAMAETHGRNWDRQLASFERQLTIEREAVTTLQRQWRDLSSSLITELSDGSAIVVLDDVALFESGAAWPSDEGTRRLRQLAELLVALPDYNITVEGHTDARPVVNAATEDIRDNWALSAVRAASTVSTLIELGIPAERLRAVGYASNRPINEDPDAAPNRRVELVLYPPIEQRVLRLRHNQGVSPATSADE